MEDQEKEIQELANKLKELNDIDFLEQCLKDNTSEFIHLDQHYRVRKLSILDRDKLSKARASKYIEILKDSSYMFRKDLTALHLTKNINISNIDQEIKRLSLTEHDLLKRLAQTSDPHDINLLKNEIEELRLQQNIKFQEKENHLQFCIEHQLESFSRLFSVFLVLEVKSEDKWTSVFKNFEDFLKCEDDVLIAKAAQMLAVTIDYENL